MTKTPNKNYAVPPLIYEELQREMPVGECPDTLFKWEDIKVEAKKPSPRRPAKSIAKSTNKAK